MIDVSPEELELVHSILAQYVPGVEVWAFGSRIKNTAKKYSDLDLALVGLNKIPNTLFQNLKEAFEESDLPFRVDLIDWNSVSQEFQRVIQKDYIVLQAGVN